MTRVRNIPDRLVQRLSLALTQLPLYRTRGLLACTQKTRGSSSEWEEYYVLFIRYFSFVKFLVPRSLILGIVGLGTSSTECAW